MSMRTAPAADTISATDPETRDMSKTYENSERAQSGSEDEM
jgi:hypothetical protein